MSDRYAHYQQLKFDRPHPRVLRITIASPLKLNAMTAILHGECSRIWRDVDADPTVSAVIITGSEKAFSPVATWSMNARPATIMSFACRG